MTPKAATTTLEALVEANVKFVSFLPESEVIMLQNMIFKDKRFIAVPVSNESAAASACSGAALCGLRAAAIVGVEGLLNMIWPLTVLNVQYGIPILLIVTNRNIGEKGWIYSIFKYVLEPQLQALRIPYLIARRLDEVKDSINRAAVSCTNWRQTTAVILTDEVVETPDAEGVVP